MIITLDGRRLGGGFAPDQPLQALIDHVRAEHLDGRLVVSVAVNGQRFVGQGLIERLSQPLEDEDRIELESGDARVIAANALRDAAAQLAAAGQVQAAIADQLNAGQVAEAIARVAEFVKVWQTSQQIVAQCCGLLGADLMACEYGDRPVHAHLRDLAGKLRELRDAFEARDMVLLADLLHYEMPPLCEAWCDLLTHLAETVAGPAAGVSAAARPS